MYLWLFLFPLQIMRSHIMIMIRTTLISLFWIWLCLSGQWSQKVNFFFFFFFFFWWGFFHFAFFVFYFFYQVDEARRWKSFFFFFGGGGDNLPSPAHCSRRLTKVFRTVSVCFVLIGFMFNSIKKSWKDSNVRTFLDITYDIWIFLIFYRRRRRMLWLTICILRLQWK